MGDSAIWRYRIQSLLTARNSWYRALILPPLSTGIALLFLSCLFLCSLLIVISSVVCSFLRCLSFLACFPSVASRLSHLLCIAHSQKSFLFTILSHLLSIVQVIMAPKRKVATAVPTAAAAAPPTGRSQPVKKSKPNSADSMGAAATATAATPISEFSPNLSGAPVTGLSATSALVVRVLSPAEMTSAPALVLPRKPVTGNAEDAESSSDEQDGEAASDTDRKQPTAKAAGGGDILDSFLWPLTKSEFMRDIYRKKAYAIITPPPTQSQPDQKWLDRIESIRSRLNDCHLRTMLETTPSEQIHVWQKPDAATAAGAQPNKRLNSVGVDDVNDALKAHAAGGSLYFRYAARSRNCFCLLFEFCSSDHLMV